jgi:hypothetical protein
MSSVQPSTAGKLPEAGPTTLYLVCDELDISPLEVLCPDRHSPLPFARELVAWLLYKWEGWTKVAIADFLGVNPSTVRYYLRNIERKRRNGEVVDLCRRLVRALTISAGPF